MFLHYNSSIQFKLWDKNTQWARQPRWTFTPPPYTTTLTIKIAARRIWYRAYVFVRDPESGAGIHRFPDRQPSHVELESWRTWYWRCLIPPGAGLSGRSSPNQSPQRLRRSFFRRTVLYTQCIVWSIPKTLLQLEKRLVRCTLDGNFEIRSVHVRSHMLNYVSKSMK